MTLGVTNVLQCNKKETLSDIPNCQGKNIIPRASGPSDIAQPPETNAQNSLCIQKMRGANYMYFTVTQHDLRFTLNI